MNDSALAELDQEQSCRRRASEERSEQSISFRRYNCWWFCLVFINRAAAAAAEGKEEEEEERSIAAVRMLAANQEAAAQQHFGWLPSYNINSLVSLLFFSLFVSRLYPAARNCSIKIEPYGSTWFLFFIRLWLHSNPSCFGCSSLSFIYTSQTRAGERKSFFLSSRGRLSWLPGSTHRTPLAQPIKRGITAAVMAAETAAARPPAREPERFCWHGLYELYGEKKKKKKKKRVVINHARQHTLYI